MTRLGDRLDSQPTACYLHLANLQNQEAVSPLAYYIDSGTALHDHSNLNFHIITLLNTVAVPSKMSLRTRLFDDNAFSPDNGVLSWSSLEAVLTPCQSANESPDSGIGSSAELSVGSPMKILHSYVFILMKMVIP